MRKHVETHTKEGWSKCNLCQNTFPDSWHLKVHERSHTGEKPHICFDCGKSYSDLSKLKRHFQTHDETPSEYKSKLHKCILCGIGFNQTYKLEVHMNYHKGVNCKATQMCRLHNKFHREKSFEASSIEPY